MLDIYIHPHSYPLHSNFFHKEKLKLPERGSLESIQRLVDLLQVNGYESEHLLYSTVLEFLSDPLKVDHVTAKFEQLSVNPAFSVSHGSFYL